KEALFRYTVVAQVRAQMLAGVCREDAIAEVAERSHARVDGGEPEEVTQRRLQRWTSAYEAAGIAVLEPKSRRRTNTSLALDEKLIDFLRRERATDSDASIPELLRRAKALGVIEGCGSFATSRIRSDLLDIAS
ncbi:MAG TPA: hypothetical protein VEC56_04770, partial [Candidatus Krumholzibacteria bacterium]|nr:hypothetical protein [Candidatus Krumholzibacteria bacterium]